MHRSYTDSILTYSYEAHGIDRAELDLRALYSPESLDGFYHRWHHFLGADKFSTEIFAINADRLCYGSTSALPSALDARMPLLILSGNPAPHSVASGTMYAFEGNGREHRIWPLLRKSAIFETSLQADFSISAVESRISAIRSLDHDSRYRLGMASFFSMPSPASHPTWSGVAGVRKLFGSIAFQKILQAETARIAQLINDLMPAGGVIISLQKNAYEALRLRESDSFTLIACRRGHLLTRTFLNEKVILASAPPTRLLKGISAVSTFSRLVQEAVATYNKLQSC